MTGKLKKTKRQQAHPQPERVAWLHASVGNDLLSQRPKRVPHPSRTLRRVGTTALSP